MPRTPAGKRVAQVGVMRLRVAACLVVGLGPAAADPAFDSTATVWLGGDLEVLPHGTLKNTGQVATTDASAQTAYAFGGTLEYLAYPWLSVAFMPRYLVDV